MTFIVFKTNLTPFNRKKKVYNPLSTKYLSFIHFILHAPKAVKEESEKVGLKLNIQKTKIMASDRITSWELDGETVKTVSDFIFGALQNHCRW